MKISAKYLYGFILGLWSFTNLLAQPTPNNVTGVDGTYNLGQSMTITVTYDAAVDITLNGGNITFLLETGLTDQTATYNGGDLTNVTSLTFTYTVQSGDESTDLDYTTAATLVLNGGATIYATGTTNNATLSLPTPGGAGSLSANQNIVVDGIVPAVPSTPNLDAGSDSGASNNDDLTNDTTPTFSGSYGENGVTINLYDNGTLVGSDVVASGSFTITSSTLAEGAHNNMYYTATDPAGNTSANSTALTSLIIDTTGPTIVLDDDHPDAVVKSGDNIIITANFTELNGLDGTPKISIGSVVSNANMTSTADPLIWTYTWSVPSGNDGAAAVSIAVNDDAGNSAAAPTAGTGPISYTIDNTDPAFVSTADIGDGNYKAGESITFDVDLGETGLTVTADLSVLDTDFSSTQALTDDGDGTYSFTTALLDAGGNMQEGTSIAVTFSATDVAGNGPVTDNSLTLLLDKTPPATPAAPDMTAATDSGSSNSDNITNDNTPDFTGSGTNGETINLISDIDGNIGSATVSGGTWTITASTNLSEGNHNITVTATDVAGNTSAASPALSITIDTTPPTTPSTPDLTAGTDSGSSSTDNITNVNTPDFTNSADDSGNNGETVVLLSSIDGNIGSTTIVGGAWSITSTVTLSDGDHNITAQITDVAGNTSTSAPLSLTIDTSPPAAPGTPDMTAATDSGNSNTDNITNDSTPDFTGSGTNGETINLISDVSGNIGSATVSGGSWTITASVVLSEGNHNITATTTDVAGNTSPASPALSITIDTTPPATPGTPDMTAGTDSGSSNTDNVTNDNTPDFTGSGINGETINLYRAGTTNIGSTTVSGGTWNITSSVLADGNHNITATATDVAGNTSLASTALPITIDTTPPAIPSTPDMTAASDSGNPTDNITNITTPTFTNSADDSGNNGETVVLVSSINGNVGTTTIALGSWTITSVALSEGNHTITAQITDIAGNIATSSALSVTIDVSAPGSFTTGNVTATGGRVVATYWNGTNTGADITVPIANDASLNGGTVQLLAKVSTDPTFSNLGTSSVISAISTNKTISVTAAEFEGIPNFGEGTTILVTAIITDLAGNSTTGTQSSSTTFVDQTAPLLSGPIRVYTNAGQISGSNHEVIQFIFNEEITLAHNDIPKNSTSFGGAGFSVDDDPIGDAYYYNDGNPNAVDNSLTNTRLVYLESSNNGTGPFPAWSVSKNTQVQYVPGGISGTSDYIVDIAGNELAAFTQVVSDGDFTPPSLNPDVMTLYPRAGNQEKIIFTISEQLNLNDGDPVTGFSTTPATGFSATYDGNNGLGPYTITMLSAVDGSWLSGTTVSYASGTGNVKDIANNELISITNHVLTVETDPPVITNVTIPNVPMNVGDIVTATITVNNDDGDVPVLTSGSIGGYPLGSFSGTGPTSYTATFTITEGGNSYAAGTDIPVTNLVLTDLQGNASSAYNTPISQTGDPVDATSPQVTSIAIASTTNTWSTTNGTSAGSVDFTVTFSEDVTGVDISDFAVATSGSLVGATVTNVVAGSGTIYTVTVSGYTNTGNLRLDFIDNNSVFDTPGGNPVISSGGNPDGSFYTGESYNIVLPEPTDHVSGFTATPISTNTITLSWTNPATPVQAATHYLLLVDGQDINDLPGTPTPVADGSLVADDFDFTDGNGAAVISATSTSYSFTTLISGNTYNFQIFPLTKSVDYPDDNTDYKGRTGAVDDGGVPAASATTPTAQLGTLTAGSTTEPATISSLSTSYGSDIVLDFKITDDGSNPAADDAKLKFTQIVITAGAGNTITNWADVIAEAELKDITDNNTETSTSITANTITFSGLATDGGDFGRVDDDATKEYQLRIRLKTTMSGTAPETVDGQRFEFEIRESGFTYKDASSSKIAASEFENSDPTAGGTNNTVTVVATQLDFITNPDPTALVLTNLTTTPVLKARDANGNLDLDFGDLGETVNVNNTDGIPMVNLEPGDKITAVNGIITFPANFQYGDSGNGTLLVTDSNNILTSPSSPTTVTVSYDSNNTITAGGLAEPTTISSVLNAAPGQAVYDFIITDDAAGAGDGSPTRITQIVITQGTGNDIANWTEAIAGATLTDGVNTISGVVNATNLTFASLPTGSGSIGYIDDSFAKTYTLNIWLKSTMGGTLAATVDNLNFVFEVTDNPANITLDALSSKFTGSESNNSGATNNAVEVVTTLLAFSTQPPATVLVNADLSTSPVLEAVDINNNRDLDYNSPLTITNAKSLGMINVPTSITAGIATFASNFRYTDIGDGSAGNGTLTAVSTTAAGNGFIPANALSSDVLVRVGATTLITSVGTASEPATIPSTTDATPGTFVFDFRVADDAGGEDDGNATIITDLVITQGTSFNDPALTDWTKVIAGAILYDDESTPNSITGVVGSNKISFSAFPGGVGQMGYIADNGSKTYKLQIWLYDSLDFRISGYTLPLASYTEPVLFADNKQLEFSIDEINVITDPTGSDIQAGEILASGNANSIDVDATSIDFTIEPPASASVNTIYSVRTEARDTNDNRDLDFGFNLTSLSNQGGLAMLNAPTSADNFTAGKFDFDPNFQYDDTGASPAGQLTLIANSLTATSQPIEVIASFDSYVTADNTTLQNNINAIQFDAADIVNDGIADVEIARFILHDGNSPLNGGLNDIDGAVTRVTDLDISITGFANLQRVALYVEDIDGSGNGLGTFSEVDEQAAASVINFEDLTTGLFYAADDKTRTFIIVASFLDSYTDNDLVQITIDKIEARLGASQFNVAEPLPATDPLKNIIEVTATQIDFQATPLDAQQGVKIPLTPAQPQVFANDAKGNLDLDFNGTVTVTSGVTMINVPTTFSNVSPGVLDFPGFQYANAGDGTLTITTGSLSTTSNAIDVIHTTISTLDIGGISNATNNGIEASPLIVAGGTNKAILGFALSAVQQTVSEPTLVDLTIRFGNPIAGVLNNIRLLSSVDSVYVYPESTVSNTTVVGTDFVTFQGINVPLTATQLYYFVVADIDPTANFSTPQITPQLIASGVPVNDVVLSSGSVEANVLGRTYGFNDVNPPVVSVFTPLNNDENFPQSSLISIQFNETVVPLDSIINIYKLIDDSFVATLKLDPLLTSADSTTFYFDPTTPALGDSLLGDTYYYILIPAGNVSTGEGFVDKSGNPYAGISSSSDWNFKTSDNVAPFFTADLPTPTLPADAVNIVDVGFDLRVALDEPGKVFYIVVDPTIDTGTPTVDEIRNGTFGTVLASGTADILRGFEYHYISIFDSNNFPTGGSGDFRVWMTAEDNALPTPNQMVDGDPTHPGKAFVDNTFAASTGSGIIVQSTPGNVPVDICLGDPQIVFAPINLVEGVNSDFNTGNGQTINFVLPASFVFDTSNITVSGQGGDISNVSASFINNTILTVSYDISGTGNRDKLIISNMRVQAIGGVGTSGDIIRLGGTGATGSIPDGSVIASLTTYQIDSVNFATDPNTTSISDINDKIPLIPDLSPLDKGISIFSGPGVFGDTLYVAAAGLGTHTIKLQYTDEQGCTTESSLVRTIFDNDRAIAGLSPSYCTNDIAAIISANGRDLFTLLDLQVEVPPDQPLGVDTINTFQINVDSSLVKVGLDYVFNPSWFHIKENFDKFTNASAGVNDGGLIGELLFTGIYNNNLDNTVFDTLQQRVKVYFSPTAELTIAGYGPIGDNTFDTLNIAPTTVAPNELEFCFDEGPVSLKGSSANGYFAVSMTIPDPNNPANQIVISDSTNFPGLTDFKDGSAELDPQFMIANSDFNYGELTIKYVTINPTGGCNSEVSQVIRIHPKPVAYYTLPPYLCEQAEIIFTDATGYAPTDSTYITNGQNVNNAVFPAITNWFWDFDDVANSGGDNFDTTANPAHTFKELGLYDVKLTTTSEFGCTADTTIQLTIGGYPQADFVFSGTNLSEDILFQSTSTVESSSNNLNHAIDRVIWDVDGDGTAEIDYFDNDPTTDNDSIFSYSGYTIAGVYDVNFVAVSTVGCRDSVTKKVAVLQNIIVDSTAINTYSETFANTNGYWIAQPENEGDTISWAWGISTITADTAWFTGIDTTYRYGERSYVYSPAFDIRGLSRPMIQFDVLRDFEDQDGVILEFSTDSKNIMDPTKSWQALGNINEGINWFNAIGLAGSPGNDATGLGWTGTDTNWVKAKHDLGVIYAGAQSDAEIDNLKSRVIFRFGLGAIPANKTKGGFAFDNVYMGNRTRTVLLENFTSMAGSTENRTENTAINDLANNSSAGNTELVVLTYRTEFDGDDPLNKANPAVPAARAVYYGISVNPRVAIDGATSPDGSNNSNLPFSQWGQEYFSKRTLQITPFDIAITPVNQGDGKLHINATITAASSEINNPVVVQIAVVEKLITANDLNVSPASGETEFYNTVRAMLPDAAGTTIASLAKGADTTITVSWQPVNIIDPATGLAPSTIEVVAFVQDAVTKEVHQASRVNVDYDLILGIDDELDSKGIALYPNPANQYINIKLANKLAAGKQALIYDNTGRKVDEVTFNRGTQLLKLNTRDYQPGIYLFVMPDTNGTVMQRFVVSHY